MAIKTNLIELLRDERGATAIEYGLIVSLIVIAIMGALNTFAGQANAMLDKVSQTTKNATAS